MVGMFKSRSLQWFAALFTSDENFPHKKPGQAKLDAGFKKIKS